MKTCLDIVENGRCKLLHIVLKRPYHNQEHGFSFIGTQNALLIKECLIKFHYNCRYTCMQINLLRLGPGASSAGGIFVPTAPMGGKDE